MNATFLAERKKAAAFADRQHGTDQTTKAWNDCFHKRLETLIARTKASRIRVANGTQKRKKSKKLVAYCDDTFKPHCNGFDQVNRYYEMNQ